MSTAGAATDCAAYLTDVGDMHPSFFKEQGTWNTAIVSLLTGAGVPVSNAEAQANAAESVLTAYDLAAWVVLHQAKAAECPFPFSAFGEQVRCRLAPQVIANGAGRRSLLPTT